MRDLQTGSDDDKWKHQVALIRCVLEQSRAMQSYHQQEFFDHTRTFQQNRKTYLSMVGIGSEVTYVEIAKLAGIIRQCKLLQREPSVDNLQQFLRPEYLPIHTRESLPWEAQCGLSYGDAQRFTAFTASVAREFSCTWDDDHEALFIIFRRLQSTRLGLPGDYLHPVRDKKPTKTDAPRRNPTSRGSRREKKGRSRARRRVQKGASVSRRQAYAFERLGGARQATGGIIECQVYWEPTWLPIEHLQGDDAIQEAKDLVVASFGSDTWHKEARKLGLIYEHGRE